MYFSHIQNNVIKLPSLDVISWIECFLSVDKKEERQFPSNLRGIGAVSFF